MKLAVGLFGTYDSIFLKNAFTDCDLFACAYTALPNTDKFIATKTINISADVKAPLRVSYIKNKFIVECNNLISTHEKNTGIIYDIYIYTTFKTLLLNLPNMPGHFATKYYSFAKLPYPIEQINTESINSIDIISDEYISINGSEYISIYNLPSNILELFLHKFFNNKVFLPSVIPNIFSSTIICIPSVINTSANPFNYSERRSVFSWDERFLQTEEQVKTLSKLEHTNSYILEGSKLGLKYLERLSQHSYVVLFCVDETGNNYANIHPNKSLYEIYVLKHMIGLLKFDTFVKIGGRYNINTIFNINDLKRDKPVFKIIPKERTYSGTPIIENIVYSIPNQYKEKYDKIYSNIHESLLSNTNEAVENLLYKETINLEYITVDNLNAIGSDGIFGFDNPI